MAAAARLVHTRFALIISQSSPQPARARTGSIGLSTLEDICELILQSHDLDQTLRNIVQLVADRMGTEVCSVYLLEGTELLLRATEGLSPASVGHVRLRVGEGLIGYTAQMREVINAPEPEKHPKFRFIAGSNEEQYHSFLGIPLYDRQQLIGVMAIQTIDLREFSRDEVSALNTIAFQLSTVIANARLLDSVNQRRGIEGASVTKIDRPVADVLSVLEGTVVNPGVAIAPAYVLVQSLGVAEVMDEEETPCDAGQERIRLRDALEKTRVETLCLEKRVADRLSDSDAAIFHAHLMILQDQSFLNKLEASIEAGHSALVALKSVIGQYVEAFRRLEDPYLRERAMDVEDVGRRILGNLQGIDATTIRLTHPGIIVARELMPSQIAMLPFELVSGIILESGQTNSHAAIVAKSMGIPTLVGVAGAIRQIEPGTPLILDAGSARVYIEPDQNIKREYQRLVHENRRKQEALLKFKDAPAQTLDQVAICLRANVGLLSDIDSARNHGASGIGLYRTEFPFMTRPSFPSRQEQYDLYRRAIESFQGQQVTFRTLDIGGDKSLPYFQPPAEENPSLGWRSVRVSLAHREIFRTQLEAILMAGRHGPVRVMFPMVTTVAELRSCRQVFSEAKENLLHEGIETPDIPLGVMVEVPATISIAKHLAKEADFFALGTNDLIQYMLAADRGNALVQQYYDPLHPAMVQAIAQMVRVATETGRELCICGEMASDPHCFALLVGLGLREFSVSAPSILPLKAMLSQLSSGRLTRLAEQALEQDDSGGTRQLIAAALQEIG